MDVFVTRLLCLVIVRLKIISEKHAVETFRKRKEASKARTEKQNTKNISKQEGCLT